MTIKKIEIFHIAIPFLQSFETSFGVISERPAVIVKMTNNEGLFGFGECSTLYVPMSEQEVVRDSMRVLAQLSKVIIDTEIRGVEELKQICDSVAGYPVTKLALEGAYFDILAQEHNQPLYQLFGATQNKVNIGESIGIKNDIAEVVEEVQNRVNQGCKRVKLKIKPGYDYEIVKAVREKFPNLLLGVDANSGYTNESLDDLVKLNEFNLLFIEQPFNGKDLELHAKLQKQISAPICLDESIVSLESCTQAVELGACKMVNIKPARIGSFVESKLIHDYCLAKGIPMFGGGRFETGIGKVANAHFFALPGFTEPADLTPPLEYFERDVIDPSLIVENGVFELSENVGIGVKVLEDTIRSYQKEVLVFE